MGDDLQGLALSRMERCWQSWVLQPHLISPEPDLKLLDRTLLMAKEITEYLSVSLIAFVLKGLHGRGFVAFRNVQYNLINNSNSFTLHVYSRY